MAAAEPSGESDLDLHAALGTLLFLQPQSSGPLQAASKSSALAKAAGDEALWAAHAGRHLGLAGPDSCLGPRGEDCGGSWREVCKLWSAAIPEAATDRALASAQVEGRARARWLAVWLRLRQWLGDHARSILDTLRPALTEEGLRELRATPGLEAADPSVLGCWCIHDGQAAPMERDWAQRLGMPALASEQDEWSRGVLGGYSVYRHQVSTLLLPVAAALQLTGFFRERGLLKGEELARLAFACSYNMEKIFFVDVRNGAVWVWTGRADCSFELSTPQPPGVLRPGCEVTLRDLQKKPELNGQQGVLAAYDKLKGRWQVKMQDGSGVHLVREENVLSASAEAPADGLLCWFEEYVTRLEDGVYSVLPLRPEAAPTMPGICLFPMKGPELSCCVTRGVEVTASCAYTPENARAGWAYSVGLRLVGSKEERGFETCQLHTRHWVIKEDGSAPSRVNGEGVVGFKPLLTDGGWILGPESDPNGQYSLKPGFMPGAFRYQSCTGPNPSMKGSFSGEITFVPGSIRKPTGEPFKVTLKEFRLGLPAFVF